jgi:hypothetical protein
MSEIATDLLIDRPMLNQVEQVLRSETLQNSETLKRLLKFLAERSAAGEADQLKEYTIAVDALAKPSTYDPRHDSAVRIQIGRLRQKLAEYYRTEGKDDLLVIDLPKGHFKLTCKPRAVIAEAAHPLAGTVGRIPTWVTPSMWLTFVLAMVLGGYSIVRIQHAEATSSPAGTRWSPELEELWQPFLATNRPMLVAFQDPLFVEFAQGPGVYYRDKSLHKWSEAASSPGVMALRKAFNNADMQPSRYYTSFGEVDAAFLIGKLLGSRQSNISLVRNSQLSWQQLADNNVVFVGVRTFFGEQSPATPLQLDLVFVDEGIQNLHPKAGEAGIFSDQFSTAPTEEGVVYALVTRSPGPMGSTEAESFMSNRAAGYVAAVQWFTDPDASRTLVDTLRKTYGRLPRHYQIVLKVEFKDEVPTKTTLVLSRELP